LHSLWPILLSTPYKDSFWLNYLTEFNFNTNSIHLAIFVQPYIGYILTGKKTIESRLSKNKCSPYGKVRHGDIILLKQSGGPVIGLCEVSEAWYYKLDPMTWSKLMIDFFDEINVKDESFWVERQAASYATLLRISHPESIQPLSVSKKDKRGWVVMDKHVQGFEYGVLSKLPVGDE
jgi:hypothetical protein